LSHKIENAEMQIMKRISWNSYIINKAQNIK